MKNPLTILMLAILVLSSGCVAALSQGRDTSAADKRFQEMGKADFAGETERLVKLAGSKEAGKKEQAEAWRQLAIIYLLPKNPGQDSDKAVDAMGRYLELSPGGLKRASAASWATAIKASREYRDLEKKAARLDRENRKLTKDNQELARKNSQLEENIEKLKDLDLSVEKKKQSFR